MMSLTQNTSSAQVEVMDPEVRRRLESAVLDVFSQSDFHQAKIRTVAEKAQISFTIIYKYYGSKERLLFSFVNDRLEELTDRLADHLQGIKDLKEKLRKYLWVQLDYYEKNPKVGRIIFMTVPLTTWMQDKTFVQERLVQILINVLREGQSAGVINPKIRPGMVIDLFNGMVQRTFSMWIYRGRQDSLVGKADVLFDMLWSAIENRECPSS